MDCRRGAADREGVRAQLGSDIRQRTPDKLTKLGAMATRTPQEWITDYPLLERLVVLEETLWLKPDLPRAEEGLAHVEITPDQIQDAADRLRRFAPYLQQVFPEIGRWESSFAHSCPLICCSVRFSIASFIAGTWRSGDSMTPALGAVSGKICCR